MAKLSRFLQPKPAVEEEQFAEDGRDLSDVSHVDYDPATDPELSKYHLKFLVAQNVD